MLDADTFFFDSKTESGITAATRDTITDFVSVVDKINLHDLVVAIALPSVTYLNGTDRTATPAQQLTATKGDMRSYWVADGLILELDATGGKKADFSIKFLDATHTIGVDAGDFTL